MPPTRSLLRPLLLTGLLAAFAAPAPGAAAAGRDTSPPALVVDAAPRFVVGSTVGEEFLPVRLHWAAGDSSGICRQKVYLQVQNGGSQPIDVAPTDRSLDFEAIVSDDELSATVVAWDCAGNRSVRRTGDEIMLLRVDDTMLVPSPQSPVPSLSYRGAWQEVRDDGHQGGVAHLTSTPGATVRSARVLMGSAAVLAETGPGQGVLSVLVDGVLVETLDLTRPEPGFRQVVWERAFPAGGKHVVTVRARGGRVAFDGFLVQQFYPGDNGT